MIRRRRWAAGLGFTCALSATGAGWAEAGRPRPGHLGAAELARARAFVKAGSALFDAGDFAGALASYQKAEPQGAALGDPAGIRWNIARCLEELGRASEAVLAFERYLELPDAPEGHADARRRIEQIERTALGRIAVACSEEGVRVQPVYAGPAQTATLGERNCPARWRRMAPGVYRFVGVTPDGRSSTAEVQVEPGREVTVQLTFVHARIAGRASDAGGSDEPVAPGLEPARIDERTTSAAGGAGPLPWVVLGGGVVSAVAGAVLLAQASGRFDDAESAYGRYRDATDTEATLAAREDTQAALDDGRTYRTAGYVLLGVGAVGAGVATWLFFDGESAPVSVNLGPESASLGWAGRW